VITVALFVLPLLGAATGLLFTRLPRLRPWQWVPDLIGSGIAALLALALLAGAGREETLFGAWFPVSVLGELMIIRPDALAAGILFALAIAQVSGALTRRAASWQRVMAAATFGVLGLAATAYNVIGLLAGIGLADAFSIARRFMRGEDARRVAGDGLALLLSTTLAVMALAAVTATATSLYFPLTEFSARQLGFLAAAVALRHGLALFHPENPAARDPGRFDSDIWATLAPALAGLILILRLPALGAPPLPDWVLALALLAGLIQLARAAADPRPARAAPRAMAGILALGVLSAAAWQPAPLAAVIIAFALGSALLRRDYGPLGGSPLLRGAATAGVAAGALLLIGAPLSVGFIARAGALDALMARVPGVGGVLIGLAWALAHALAVVYVLRTLSSATPNAVAARVNSPLRRRLGQGWALGATGLLLLAGLGLSVAPMLFGASLADAFSAAGPAGWLSWTAGSALGAALWAFRARLPARLRALEPALDTPLSLQPIVGPLAGAMTRLSRPLAGVFIALESDGALLWTVAIALIIVLIARSPGP
jgi:hypothetical protein